MSIAEKLQTVANNMPLVHQAGYTNGYEIGYEAGVTEGAEVGYAKGEQEGYNKGVAEVEAQNAEILTDCNTALTEKGAFTADTIADVPRKIDSIVVEEDMLKYAMTATFANLNDFGKAEVVLNFDKIWYSNNMFADKKSNTTVKHLTINFSTRVSGAYQMFMAWSGDVTMERLTLNADFSEAGSCDAFLKYRRALKVVDGTPLNFSSVPTTTNISILECQALEEIRFAPNSLKTKFSILHSPLLSAETIQSIIDGLADLTGATARQVLWHTDVLLKLTDEQLFAITAKNWTM